MNKEEYIEKNGLERYEKYQRQKRDWKRAHPAQVQKDSREKSHKDGKHYKKARLYEMTGLRHARSLVRRTYAKQWYRFKQIIDPDGLTQCHHQWLVGKADYQGVALVEKDKHRHGFIDVIKILEGEITLFTEKEISAIPCPC